MILALLRALAFGLLLTACGSENSRPSAAVPAALQTLPVVSTPAYELIPGGRLVVVLATSAHDTLYGNVTGGQTAELIGAGFSLLSLDLPCHGPGEATLRCWRERLQAGDDDLFLRFCAGLSNVLDVLGARDVSIVGQSRGGYVAITCAAYDSRIKTIALVVPVTDLQRLSEFQHYTVDQSLHGTDQFVPYLRGRPVLVRIGNRDDRVGTDAAVAFAAKVGADLQLLDMDGHQVPVNGSVASWLLEHS